MLTKTYNIGTYLIAAALFLFIVPVYFPPYQVCVLTEIIIFALFAVSYNMLLGNAGLLSFGHAMFFGFGAYVTALSVNHWPGLPIYGVIIVSVFATMMIGLFLGSLLLRHKGSSFALLTLAFNALFWSIAFKWHSLTGGDDGISISRPDLDFAFIKFGMSDINPFYVFTLLVIGAILLFCYYFSTTAMGKTVLLMRENEERMKFLGYNTNIARLILFTFTASLAGCAGSFYALNFEFTSPTAISLEMTTTVLLMTFIGGTKNFWGPILGAAVYIYLQTYLSEVTDRWQLIMGIIFIIMVLYVPNGLSGSILEIKEKLSNMFRSMNTSAGRGLENE